MPEATRRPRLYRLVDRRRDVDILEPALLVHIQSRAVPRLNPRGRRARRSRHPQRQKSEALEGSAPVDAPSAVLCGRAERERCAVPTRAARRDSREGGRARRCCRGSREERFRGVEEAGAQECRAQHPVPERAESLGLRHGKQPSDRDPPRDKSLSAAEWRSRKSRCFRCGTRHCNAQTRCKRRTFSWKGGHSVLTSGQIVFFGK